MKKTLSLLIVIAMIACMLPAFTVSAAEPGTVLPIATTPNGWELTAQPTEPWAKNWTANETELSLNGGCDQGYYVFDNAVPAGKVTAHVFSNAASNSCNGIVFCLTDTQDDRAFWEGDDMSCYWLFVDEGNRLRLSEVGKHGGNPGWHELIGAGDQVDLDDKGIDVTKGFDLTAEWDGKGNIKAYVNGELVNTIDDTASPMTGTLCGFRMKEKPVSGFYASSVVVAPAVVEITTAEQFLSIENNLGGNYKLMNDITITEGLSYKEEGKHFTGTFDGNGKTITLDFVDTNWARSAVFCTVSGNATIKNLNVAGKMESNGNSTAALIGTVVGDQTNVTIENVTTDVSFKADNSTNGQGGIIGAVENNATVNMTNCVNKGDIIGEVVGGLIGGVHGGATKINITNCSNEGDITSTNYYADYRGAGGFIGKVQNGGATVTIKNSTNKGNVTAKFVVANAYVGHNNSGHYTVEGCSNSGKVISGGLELPAATATARDQGIWGSAGFGFNFDEGKLSGSPEFHATPSMNNWKAYINGVEATDKVTITDKGNRRVEIVAMCNGLYDGYASVTIVWENGQYSTFGTKAPSKADADQVHNSADLIGKLTETPVDGGSATVTNPLYENGFEDNLKPHGSLGNLFDADAGNKYEGWHVLGSGSLIIDFALSTETKITHYALGTGNDDANFSDRQPAEWKFYGSTDGQTWVLLSHVKKGDNLPNVNNKLVVFAAEETDVAYKYARLEVLSFISEEGREVPPAGERLQGVYVQIGQIKVYTCEHTVENDSCTNCGKDFAPEAPETNEPETNVPKTGDAVLAISALALVAAAATVVVARRRKIED